MNYSLNVIFVLSAVILKLTAVLDSELKCQSRYLSGQIASLIKVSILKATYREAVCSDVGDHVFKAATEAEAASTRAANCITPIEAVFAFDDRTTVISALARHGQFKGRCKSANA